MRGLYNRRRLWKVSLVTAGSLFVLEGCDTSVRDTVLTGVGSAASSLASTFISAFIQSLQADETDATTVRNFVAPVSEYFA